MLKIVMVGSGGREVAYLKVSKNEREERKREGGRVVGGGCQGPTCPIQGHTPSDIPSLH